MTCSGFASRGGRVIPTVYKMETAGKEGQFTVMEITDTRFDIALPDQIFTMQNLQRR